eukprot:scaffold51495_cov38-Cyclotella_meneghiniana.AAC.4
MATSSKLPFTTTTSSISSSGFSIISLMTMSRRRPQSRYKERLNRRPLPPYLPLHLLPPQPTKWK